MPRDEIGMIKEGPAIRYLNGQALWDKKYKHALKSIRRHREKNLRNAKERDSGKIRGMWQKRIDKERLEREHKKDRGGSKASGRARTPDENDQGWETDAASDVEDDGGHGEVEKSLTDELVDQSWSWSWAWGGEVPPPSAIVSRRDFVRRLSFDLEATRGADDQAEARQMALMADRMDRSNGPQFNGLSIWIGLAGFFTNSSERDKARQALQRAHEEKKADRAGRGTLPGESPPGQGTVEGMERKAKGVGRFFGMGRG
jgi:hypothetical protein